MTTPMNFPLFVAAGEALEAADLDARHIGDGVQAPRRAVERNAQVAGADGLQITPPRGWPGRKRPGFRGKRNKNRS